VQVRYRVEINPSYEWAEGAENLGISHRELEVFALVTEGYNNKEAAEILHIKHQSVKNHMHRFTKKLGVKNTGQAVIVALHNRLIRMRGIYGDASVEVTAEELVERIRRVVNGLDWMRGWTEKDKTRMRVFLLSRGIDIDKLEERGAKKRE